MIIDRTNHNNKNHYSGNNRKLYITIHQTGNSSKGANAIAHGNLIANGFKSTWHYTVDEKNIVKHFNDNIQCWHCGDGYGNGNLNSIGIELCINSDGDYLGTLKNSVKLIKQLMIKYNIPINRVVQHNHWSGKNCPMQIRQGKHGVNWLQYIDMIKGVKSKPTPTPTPKPTPTSNDYLLYFAKDVINGRYGNGKERKENIYKAVQNKVNEILK